MIVSKFGGTSVGTYEAMQRSAKIVAADSDRRLIVISATSGTTNDLVALSASQLNSTMREELLGNIEKRHLEIIGHCKDQEHVRDRFYTEFSKLREHLDFVGRDKRWKDQLYAYGEMMSTRIFVEVLKENGVDAEWLDAREIMKTDSTFGNAEPNLVSIKKKADKLLQKEKIYLTQGFIGSDVFGNTTTLGRGGSDFSASLFAEVVGADTLEIWTDVAGVFTTDPRIVPNAHPIYEITFDEAAELSVFGGKVLHPATLKPAIRGGVNVRVASSSDPDKPGTYIVEDAEKKPPIRAISLRKDQTLLTVNSLEMLHQHGFLAHLFKVLAEHKISVDLVSTSEVSVALTLDTAVNAANKVELTDDVLDELGHFAEIIVEKDLALIALIGNNLQKTSGIGGPLFTALENYNVRLICHGASPNNLCFLIDLDQAEDVVRMLHEKFITE
ncbi:MAG: lysine-sensitive aspartokinase 3 [Gracilimonas sp.]|uniref:lysine-sensitive aspartokinase 3 n=1 Tax=Gracilimonas sp. TaxID=1974203 RepID=UPI0019C61D2E|nr:lysine-sensitive aspartokinase 3 [Gracilimonas sp.]MBD3615308.1 lysine-sensitive aspartokinase 3 [Gracilimonas sp.]